MLKVFLLLGIALVAVSLGHVCLKLGTGSIGEFPLKDIRLWPSYFLQIVTTPFILLGVFCHATFFSLWLIILSMKDAELSFVLPITSMEYLLSAFWAKFILAENVSLLRVAGTGVVCIGVILICLDRIGR